MRRGSADGQYVAASRQVHRSFAILSPTGAAILCILNMEIVMNRQLQAFAPPAAKRNAGRSAHAYVVGFLGLLPIGLVSSLMLLQIFGVWEY